MEDELILVDFRDKEIGSMSKTDAHKNGKLHRAFSIFLVRDNEMLIQRRNKNKYHSGGKWANACCSHPRVGETLENSIHRRLKEELGVDCDLKELYSFTYFSKYADDLFEFEYDHVFIGKYESDVYPNLDEIDEVYWIDTNELEEKIRKEPESFATWFLSAVKEVLKYMEDGV